MKQLIELIKTETTTPPPEAVQKLTAAITKRGHVSAILFYGSGLWKAAEDDTIYDFYVLVDHFRDFDSRALPTILGSTLPPNVYYMELKDGEKTLRCKYAVMRMDQFVKAAKGRSSTPQIWARFAQPCRITYARDDAAAQSTLEALAHCTLTFHRKTLPLTPKNAPAREIWLRGLRETYSAELRSERPERTQALFDANAQSFTARTEAAIALLPNIPRNSTAARITGRIKRPFQKSVTFLRLMKATLTFENGVDYALWKIERQSGVHMEATNLQRRYPLIAAWPLVWKLWRKGAFR
ncbi:MAG: hypothetical protein R3E13_05975 [Alphaproteobacteria bacterium]